MQQIIDFARAKPELFMGVIVGIIILVGIILMIYLTVKTRRDYKKTQKQFIEHDDSDEESDGIGLDGETCFQPGKRRGEPTYPFEEPDERRSGIEDDSRPFR